MSDKVIVVRRKTPPERITVALLPYEDAEDKLVGALAVLPHSEPECFEVRTDPGYQILNKGELRKLGQALIDMSEDE